MLAELSEGMLTSLIERRSQSQHCYLSVRESPRPSPLIELWHIYAMFVRVVLALNLHIAQHFFGVSARHFQRGHPVDNVDGQAKTIDLVLNRQIERRVDVPLFFVTTDVQVLVVGPSVS